MSNEEEKSFFNFDDDSIEKIKSILNDLKVPINDYQEESLSIIEKFAKYPNLYDMCFKDKYLISTSLQKATIAGCAYGFFQKSNLFNKNKDPELKNNYNGATMSLAKNLEVECYSKYLVIDESNMSNIKETYFKFLENALANSTITDDNIMVHYVEISFEDAMLLKILLHAVFSRNENTPKIRYIQELMIDINNIINNNLKAIKDKFGKDFHTITQDLQISIPHVYLLNCKCSYCSNN